MSQPDLLLPSIVLLPFAAALVALAVGRLLGRWTGVLMVLAAVYSFTQALGLARGGGSITTFVYPWIPAMNINAAFRGDSFGLFFALLISGIGILVGLYALGYMPTLAPGRLGQFYAALTIFMGSMLGVALADDLMLLFVFWEITSLSSYILIGFWYEEEQARKGAWIALQVTALGGVAMMVGFVAVGVVCGTFSLSQLAAQAPLQQALAASPLAVPALLLVLVGAMTKSAQWPFHFWLPGAMVAPTPVSTYLHAATMVKAGIFLLGRVLPIFGQSPLWTPILVALGLTTFLLGAYQAFHETDLKAILARTTLSTLGLITMMYGLRAANQDALQFLSHATYKGALFLIAGIVEHATHTRDIRELGGLRRRMPVTFAVCLLAALSMAGIPGFLGFFAKEGLYAELLDGQALGSAFLQWAVIGLSVLANAFIFAVSCKLLIGVFLGSPSTRAAQAREATPVLWGPPAVLAGLALGLGLFAPATELFSNRFSSHASPPLHVSLLPSHLAPLVLSAIGILLGIAIYARKPLLRALDRLPTMDELWVGMMDGVTSFAVVFSRLWQNGAVRWYFAGILLFTVGLTNLSLWRGGISLTSVTVSFREVSWLGLALCVLLVCTALLVATSATRLGASIAVTANGFITALLFVFYRSPDILLTQILIETVSTIFILLILYYLPPFRREGTSTFGRTVNLAISAAVAFSMFTFMVLSTSPQFRETKNLALDYLTRSLAEAGGANAVNVIIVDFRAMDTNGEITVLMVVGLMVYGLLRARRKRSQS